MTRRDVLKGALSLPLFGFLSAKASGNRGSEAQPSKRPEGASETVAQYKFPLRCVGPNQYELVISADDFRRAADSACRKYGVDITWSERFPGGTP
jgi:hypothetical protein